ncbi:MAG TPA: ATP-binding protein [Stenomitos sp.]
MSPSVPPLKLSDAELAQLQELARQQGLSEAEFLHCAIQRSLAGTDHQGMQDGLPGNEAKLTAIVDHAPDPIFIKDRKGRYLLLNPAGVALVKRPLAEILGRTDAELLPSEIARRIEADDRQVLTERRPYTVENVLGSGQSERVYQTIKFPYCSSTGELLGLIGISRDITEQKRLENALTELAQGLSASTGQTFFTSIAQYLAKALHVDYVLIDEVSATDPATMRPVVLLRRGEVVEGFAYPLQGTPCQQVFGQQFRAFPFELAMQFPEDPFLKPLGLESYAGMPLFDSAGNPMGLVAVMHTAPLANVDDAYMLLKVVAKRLEAELERKRAEEEVIQRTVELEKAKELDRLKSSFVNSVSHELRTPLTSIKGYAEFLEDHIGGSLTPTQEQFVRQIQDSTQRLQRLVDDLLDFARMEAGTFLLKLEQVDMAPQIREIVDSFLPQANEANVALRMDHLDQPLVMRVDAQRIGQVLANLLSNALKFTPSGGAVTVRVLLEEDTVRFEVEDNGEGIAPEDMARLFQRFVQLDSGKRKKGTGLGLSISKALVEAHGGSIGVRSAQPHGAVFWVSLPRWGAPPES